MNKLLVLLILLSGSVLADDNYQCTINAVSSVNELGDIEQDYKQPYTGEVFEVNIKSGIMSGFLQNTLGGIPQVVQGASNDWEYKVITESITNHTDIYYLTIKDFQYASSKPFMFIQSGFIFHGICE